MKEVFIVSAVRTPVGKAPSGRLKTVHPADLGAVVLKEVLKRAPQIAPEQIDDVIIGCAMPEGPQGMNMARLATLRAGLPDTVPAVTINRFCSSGLEAIAMGAQRILSGMAEIVIAGGTESMSQVPMTGFKLTPNPCLVNEMPDAYLAMGLTAENGPANFKFRGRIRMLLLTRAIKKPSQPLRRGDLRKNPFPSAGAKSPWIKTANAKWRSLCSTPTKAPGATPRWKNLRRCGRRLVPRVP